MQPEYKGKVRIFLRVSDNTQSYSNHVIIITIPPMLVKLSVRIENVMNI